jgi:orotate phosphoribosyltransferase
VKKLSHTQCLIEAVKTGSVHFASSSTRIVSSSGRHQNWLIDLRPFLLDADNLQVLCDYFWEKFEDRLPFQIGGMEVAAVPLVTALVLSARARGLKTSGFVIRKERKRTGLGRRIEGNITNDPIVLVDDILNSGASLNKALKALAQEGIKSTTVFVVIDYESTKGRTWVKENEVELHSLMTLKDIGLSLQKNKRTPKSKYKLLWRFIEPGAFPYHVVPKSTPLLVHDNIFMGTDAGKMVCIDRRNGKQEWSFDVKTTHPKGIWSSPAHFDGRIYFGAYDGNVYCLDAITGVLIWKNPCCEFIGSSPLIVPELNTMYLGLEHQRPRQMGSNAAFDLKTSNRIWERGQHKYQHGSAAYSKKIQAVVFGNADHNVTAYSALTGEILWECPTRRSIKYPPSIDDELGIVAAASFDGNIYIIDLQTGVLKSAIKTDDICYTSPLIDDGKVFAGSGDRHLYIIDARMGTVLKKHNCHARVYSTPRNLGGRVIFGTNGGKITAIDTQTLEKTTLFELPDAITNAVSMSEDGKTLYASTCMNELYAISLKNQ